MVKELVVVVPVAVVHVPPFVNCCHVTVPVAPVIVNVALLDGWVVVTSQSIVGLVELEEEVTAMVPATGVASTLTVAVFEVILPHPPVIVT